MSDTDRRIAVGAALHSRQEASAHLQLLGVLSSGQFLLQRVGILIATDQTSRVNSGVHPRMMLMFITLAPTFSSATTDEGSSS